jgi:hypothetical protein
MDDDMDKMLKEMERKAAEMEKLFKGGPPGEADMQSISEMQKDLQKMMQSMMAGMMDSVPDDMKGMVAGAMGDAQKANVTEEPEKKKKQEVVMDTEDGADIEKMMREMMLEAEKK